MLHQLLVAGQAPAANKIAELLSDRLRRSLFRKYPHLDRNLIYESVSEALLKYLETPTAFDSQKGISLEQFLKSNAKRRLGTKLRSEERRRRRETEFLELSEKMFVELRDAAAQYPMEDEEEALHQTLGQLAQTDRKLVELMANGERRTEEFAKVLKISNQAASEQRRHVKKAKDRILKMLMRRLSRIRRYRSAGFSADDGNPKACKQK